MYHYVQINNIHSLTNVLHDMLLATNVMIQEMHYVMMRYEDDRLDDDERCLYENARRGADHPCNREPERERPARAAQREGARSRSRSR